MLYNKCMKKFKSGLVPIILLVILILGLVLGQGCITITTPDMSEPTTSVNVTPPPPINPSWTPPSSASQPIDIEDLPAIAEAVAG